jgi:hypothetical protein
MSVSLLPRNAVHGLSFPIADLTLLGGWAQSHDLQMKVQLDHGVDGEEYEEVLTFSRQDGPVVQWFMWRNQDFVFVQPLLGRRLRYTSVAEALEALTPEEQPQLSDINASSWPR